jgi:hypothetical protein
MERIILEDMDKLLSPVEQAKMIGLIKEPEQLQFEQKRNYILYGFGIAGIFALGYLAFQYFSKKKEKIN